jgi:hypothetical protein
MARGKLAGNLFNNVFHRMIRKMTWPCSVSLQLQHQNLKLLTCLEHLIFPKLSLCRMKRLFWPIVPTCRHPWLTLL